MNARCHDCTLVQSYFSNYIFF